MTSIIRKEQRIPRPNCDKIKQLIIDRTYWVYQRFKEDPEVFLEDPDFHQFLLYVRALSNNDQFKRICLNYYKDRQLHDLFTRMDNLGIEHSTRSRVLRYARKKWEPLELDG